MIGCDANGTNCVLQITVTNSSKAVQSTNVLPFVPPKAMRLPVAVVTATVGASVSVVVDGETEEAEITLTTSATAMFVMLTTKESGRFSDNAFLLEAGAVRKVSFVAWGVLDIAALKASLRVEHLQQNL